MLPEGHRNLEDDSGKYVSAFYMMTGSTAKPSVLLQSSAFVRISHNFYIKVDSDPEVVSRPPLCAHTAVFNAPDNLGQCFLCQTVDLWTRTQKVWYSKLYRLKIRSVNVHVDASSSSFARGCH